MDFEYCVENFDTIESISNRFDVPVDAIVELNHITGSLPKVLKIPVQSKGGYAVLLNFKREYLAFKNSDKVRINLAKLNEHNNNVNSYGNDLKDGTNFALLLRTLASLDGDFKIKFMSSHPKDFSDEVIDTIAKYDKIAKVIHLPVQSGSTAILKSMNRNYTREHYLKLVNRIKSTIPNVYLSTDIIVGFPGETEEDFMDTYTMVEEVKYDGVFAFIYSKRSGTIAANMDNQIPEDVKNARVNKLLALTKSITKENNIAIVGGDYNVIIKDKLDDGYLALTDSGKNITILTNETLDIGEFYTAHIECFKNNKLYAKII